MPRSSRVLERYVDINRRAAQVNQGFPCRVNGCPKTRRWTKQYCRWHSDRARYFGHPKGHMIRRGFYQGYFRGVRKLIKRCPASTLAVIYRVIGQILTPHPAPKARRAVHRVSWSRAYLLRSELERIRDVPDRDKRALLIVSSIFLLSHRQTPILPDDERLTRMLAHGVLKLAPRPRHCRGKPPGASVTQAIGTRLREALAPWFLHCVSHYVEPPPHGLANRPRRRKTPL